VTGLAPEDFYAEVTASTAIVAGLLTQRGPDLAIPTCPGWTLRNLATHVGRAHRWAAQTAATRSAEFIEFRLVPDGRLPDETDEQAAWLHAGAQRLIGAVREAGSDPVWAIDGQLHPASFWGRRMAHETLVHRADAELAAGLKPRFVPALAADAVDEYLALLSGPVFGRPDPRLTALPDGASLHVHAAGGAQPQASAEWLIRRDGGQISVDRGPGDAAHAEGAQGDAALHGPAGAVLLALTRRIPLDGSGAEVHGDRALLTRWLDQTPF
jgi:uncharacterized protein (TIGR03083 family)